MIIGQAHLFISLYLFGLAMNWDHLYLSFGFTESKPTIIGLLLFFQFVMYVQFYDCLFIRLGDLLIT